MAKGDAGEAKQELSYQKNRYQGQVDPYIKQAYSNYTYGIGQNMQDYNNLKQGFNKFAETGGFSPTDITELRARSMSPIRASYANAGREVNRSRALQGGYSPNTPAVIARMAREQGQLGSDTSTNVNAGLAKMIQEGKLAGLQGGTSLYGTTPGMAALFGNQALNAIQGSGQFGNEMINNRINISKIPSTFQNVMGNLGQIGNMFGNVMNAMPGGGGNQIPGMGGGSNPYDQSGNGWVEGNGWTDENGDYHEFLPSTPVNIPYTMPEYGG